MLLYRFVYGFLNFATSLLVFFASGCPVLSGSCVFLSIRSHGKNGDTRLSRSGASRMGAGGQVTRERERRGRGGGRQGERGERESEGERERRREGRREGRRERGTEGWRESPGEGGGE